MNYVFAVSDGTGGTAQRALEAALAQFSMAEPVVEVRPGIRSREQVDAVISEAAQADAFIAHTIVSNSLRDYLMNAARYQNVETIDLIGPLLSKLSEQLSVTPMEKPGLFKQLNEEYFRRIETMEFAIKHDDGLRSEELHDAEIVLVGVSRTFKTPLCVYLAFKGWFAANVPIVLNRQIPDILNELPPHRVIGLKMNTRRLSLLRTTRNKHLKGAVSEYADLEYCQKEAIYALKIFEKAPKWEVIDVTGKPIEESAAMIISLVSKGEKPAKASL
ncbi:MAG: pyruvate, phosphate dikinase/phosphoenolpyruvate synthase regulator [Candidatus Marinimicrobia bacterium]|nr:pyruvate, phosphate dikinase/phosphoenolpyruvate synthase regulator [Candidatus Neomarinimicrobiota bacterium]